MKGADLTAWGPAEAHELAVGEQQRVRRGQGQGHTRRGDHRGLQQLLHISILHRWESEQSMQQLLQPSHVHRGGGEHSQCSMQLTPQHTQQALKLSSGDDKGPATHTPLPCQPREPSGMLGHSQPSQAQRASWNAFAGKNSLKGTGPHSAATCTSPLVLLHPKLQTGFSFTGQRPCGPLCHARVRLHAGP